MRDPGQPDAALSHRALRRLLLWAGIALALLTAVFFAVLISGCAACGAKPDGERLARAQRSPQWHEDQFKDPQAIWIDSRRAMLHFIFGKSEPTARPDAPVPVVHTSAAALASAPQSGLRVTWFGHSSTLIEVDGSKIVIDPFWSERASPFAWAGPKRWFRCIGRCSSWHNILGPNPLNACVWRLAATMSKFSRRAPVRASNRRSTR